MDLLNTSQLDTGGAARYNYYSITTAFDFNPINGKEANSLHKKVKSIIQQRAEIMDDIYFRVYKNDGTFPFSGIDAADDGQAIYQYLFSTSTHSDGWQGANNIKIALQQALLSSDIEPKENTFSINKKMTYDSGFRFYAKQTQQDGTIVLSQVERSRTLFSSVMPTIDDGNMGDFMLWMHENIIQYFYKDSDDHWEEVTNKMHINVDAPTDPEVKYWLVPGNITFTKFEASQWTTSKVGVYANIAPADAALLWLNHKSSGTVVAEYREGTWQAANLSAMWVLDEYTWFLNPITNQINTSIYVHDENAALVGFDISSVDGNDPTKPDVTVKNPKNTIYLSGDNIIDGSWRWSRVADRIHLQQKINAVWSNRVIVDEAATNTLITRASDISIGVGNRDESALPTQAEVTTDAFGRKSAMVSRWSTPVGTAELILSTNDGSFSQRILATSDVATGTLLVFQPDSTYKPAYVVGLNGKTAVTDLQSLPLNDRLDATLLKNADKLGGSNQYRGNINTTSTLDIFTNAQKGWYWQVADGEFTLGGQLLRLGDEVIALVEIVGTPVNLTDVTKFAIKHTLTLKAKYNAIGSLSIVEPKGLVLDENNAMLSLKTHPNQFTFDGVTGEMSIKLDPVFTTTPFGISLQATGPLDATAPNGLELKHNATLSVNNNELGVNGPAIDVFLLKNVSLLNKGNYRGVIPTTLDQLADAKKGDWWKADKNTIVDNSQFGPGDELFCVTDVTGTPTNLTTSFSTVKNINAVMVGATSTSDGISGTAPAPKAGDQDKVLHGDGSWKSVEASIKIYDANDAHESGEIVIYKNIMCKANASIDANKPFEWGTIGQTWAPLLPYTFRGIFTVGQSYSKDEVVVVGDSAFYRASANFTATQAPFTGTDENARQWIPLTSISTGADVFKGASVTAPGVVGMVPSSTITDMDKMLSGDGSWKDPHNIKDQANATKLYKLVVENGLPYLEELN